MIVQTGARIVVDVNTTIPRTLTFQMTRTGSDKGATMTVQVVHNGVFSTIHLDPEDSREVLRWMLGNSSILQNS